MNELIEFFNTFNENAILDLKNKKENARKVVEQSFSEEIILNKFYDLI